MRTFRPLVAVVVAAGLLVAGAPSARGDSGNLAAARERANAAAAELAAAETRLAELEVELAEQQRRLADAEAAMAGLTATMRETAVDAYIGSYTDTGAAILDEVDPNRQAQVEALSRFVTQGNTDAIDAYRVVAEEAAIARQALEETLGEQRSAVEELEARRRALDAELARLTELERQRQEEERRRQEAAARRRGGGGTSRSAPSTPIVTGSFVCPVQGPVAFVDSWGAPRSGGRRHQGVDMMSPRGTPTVAPVSGRVTHRGNSVGGLSWHLYGDDGNYYYGTHLSAYANEGAGRVQAGTIIGYVGDTGNARGNPHLHFEFHPGGGAAVNPYPLVRRVC